MQQRVGLIEELRKGQSGPVHLLDEVSRALPDGLWLTELKQDGATVTLDGRCTTLTALSDLVANLTASGYFATGVELINSQVETAPVAGAPRSYSLHGQGAVRSARCVARARFWEAAGIAVRARPR